MYFTTIYSHSRFDFYVNCNGYSSKGFFIDQPEDHSSEIFFYESTQDTTNPESNGHTCVFLVFASRPFTAVLGRAVIVVIVDAARLCTWSFGFRFLLLKPVIRIRAQG